MKVSEKCRHIGYSYPGVPNGWKPIVEKAIVEIEKEMWPRWIPMSVKRKIHFLATGNSVVRIRNKFWYKVRSTLTKNQIISDIKDKFATLRIYGFFGEKIGDIVRRAEKECLETCESCGGKEKVKMVGHSWVYNLCITCRKKRGFFKKKPKKVKPLNEDTNNR